MQRATSDPSVSSDTYKLGSSAHRARLRLWQALAVLSHFVVEEAAARSALAAVLQLLGGCHPPSVKQYMESTAAVLLLRFPGLAGPLLLPQLDPACERTGVVASAAVIAAQLALHAGSETRAQLLPRLLPALLPWATHPAHTLRTVSTLVLHVLITLIPPEERSQGGGAGEDGEMALLHSLAHFLAAQPDMARLHAALAPALLAWSPAGAAAPRGVFALGGGGGAKAEAAGAAEGAPAGAVERVAAFLAAERGRLREAAADRQASFEGGGSSSGAGTGLEGAVASTLAAGAGGVGNFQRKGGASGPASSSGAPGGSGVHAGAPAAATADAALAAGAGIAPDLLDALAAALGPGEGEGEGAAWATPTAGGAAAPAPGGALQRRRAQQLIVVASLIDRLPNLAGLARTCEVFGAEVRHRGWLPLSPTQANELAWGSAPQPACNQWARMRLSASVHPLTIQPASIGRPPPPLVSIRLPPTFHLGAGKVRGTGVAGSCSLNPSNHQPLGSLCCHAAGAGAVRPARHAAASLHLCVCHCGALAGAA